MAVEIVDYPWKMMIFRSYVSSEGNYPISWPQAFRFSLRIGVISPVISPEWWWVYKGNWFQTNCHLPRCVRRDLSWFILIWMTGDIWGSLKAMAGENDALMDKAMAGMPCMLVKINTFSEAPHSFASLWDFLQLSGCLSLLNSSFCSLTWSFSCLTSKFLLLYIQFW